MTVIAKSPHKTSKKAEEKGAVAMGPFPRIARRKLRFLRNLAEHQQWPMLYPIQKIPTTQDEPHREKRKRVERRREATWRNIDQHRTWNYDGDHHGARTNEKTAFASTAKAAAYCDWGSAHGKRASSALPIIEARQQAAIEVRWCVFVVAVMQKALLTLTFTVIGGMWKWGRLTTHRRETW
jgi:hypothetical protein